MDFFIVALFSIALCYARVNGGALRPQEPSTGDATSWSGRPGPPGSWPGAVGYPGVSGTPQMYTRPTFGGYAGVSGIPVRYTGPTAGGFPGVSETPVEYTGSTDGGYPGVSGTPVGFSGPTAGGYPGVSGTPLGYTGPTALPQVLPDGTLADVPEVAMARAAHLTALQIAASDPRASDGDSGEYRDTSYYHERQAHLGSYPGSRQLGEQQSVRQGPLSYARAEAALGSLKENNPAATLNPTRFSAQSVQPYFGTLAVPQVLSPGYLKDTQEVTSAKLNHLRALAEMEAASWRRQELK